MELDSFSLELERALNHLIEDLSRIHTGRANPELVDDVKIEAYGVENPLKNVASISVSDSRSLIIQPWDKGLLESIVSGINNSGLGFSPSIEGEIVRVKIPDLTEERRLQFVKVMKEKVELSRINVRNIRHDVMKEIDQNVSNGMPKDEGDRLKAEVEKKVKETNEKIEKMKDDKEKDLMTI